MKKTLIRNLRLLFLSFPGFIKKPVRKIIRDRFLKEAWERARRTKVSKEEIERVIDNLEKNDSDVFLQTSTMNIGKVGGGTKFIADRLEHYVDTRKHTLLIIAMPCDTGMKEYVKNSKNSVFDVRSAPVAVGAINEYFAERTDALRSLHPTHSVVAIGPRAEEYTRDHRFSQTPFDGNSPYYKLIMNGGKLLCFGTPGNITTLHAVEDMLGNLFPARLYSKKKYDLKTIDKNGTEHTVSTPFHNPRVSIRRDGTEFFDTMKRRGLWNSIPIGESEVILLDARRTMLVYLDMIQHGTSFYGKHKVSNDLYKKIEEIKTMLTQ